jgi:hypothetical protein
VPSLQRLLGHLEESLTDLERSMGTAARKPSAGKSPAKKVPAKKPAARKPAAKKPAAKKPAAPRRRPAS